MTVQTWTLMAIQVLPLFLLPEILLPWLDHHGFLPAAVADKLPPAPQVRPLDVEAAAAKKAEIDAGWAKVAVGN